MIRPIIAQPPVHPVVTEGWILTMIIISGSVASLGLAALILRSRWWRIYVTVIGFLQFVPLESRHMSRQAYQFIQFSPVPRDQQRWLTIMLIHHLRHTPRHQRRPWRIVRAIWRQRHIHCVPHRTVITFPMASKTRHFNPPHPPS